ncbi:MAG: restriction endonuclease [bacterium]
MMIVLTTVLVVAVFLGVYLFLSSNTGSDKVTAVRKTPERQVEDLTVEEFHELARDHLSDQGYEFSEAGEGYYLANKTDQVYYVRIDPAAECRDPRTMNELIMNVRQSPADTGLIVTTRAIKGQAYSLAQRTDMDILTPEDLVRDQRTDEDT